MSMQIREISQAVFDRMNEMKEKNINSLIEKMQKTNRVFSKSDLRALLLDQFAVFSKEVTATFTDPEEVDFAQMFLSSFRIQMIGGIEKRRIVMLLGDRLQ